MKANLLLFNEMIMKSVIRVRLPRESELALKLVQESTKITKKEFLDKTIIESRVRLLEEFKRVIESPGMYSPDKNSLDRHIKYYKANAGDYITFAISPKSKAVLKEISKMLGVGMGVSVYLLLRPISTVLNADTDRDKRVDAKMRKIASLMEEISPAAFMIYELWNEVRDEFPDYDESSPCYRELMYFFEGFNEFSYNSNEDD